MTSSPDAFQKAFGEIRTTSEEDNGLAVRQTQWRSLAVTVLLQDGLPKQATYHLQALDFAIVNQLLAEHGGGRNWDVPSDDEWNIPDQPPRRWVRADQAVELRILENDAIQLLDPDWEPPTTISPAPPAEYPESSPSVAEREEPPAAPRPQPARPAEIPTAGMSRQEVLARYGAPTGRMASGAYEVLLFPWGSVWFAQDRVVLVE